MNKKLMRLSIEEYAKAQTATLLERLAPQVGRTAQSPDPEAVHDLRVEVRHLVNCFRVFKQFFPNPVGKKTAHRLQTLKKLAGEVRDRDIALEVLVSRLGLQDDDLSAWLLNEREKAEQELREALQRWTRRKFLRKWRRMIDL